LRDPAAVTVAVSLAELLVFLASSAVWRFRVGRSGSSAAGGVLLVVEPESAVVSGVRRCMVGRLGSSAGVLPVDVVDGAVDPVVVSLLPEEVASGVRRFMVGRSGSSAGFELVSAGVLDVVDDVPELDGSELDGSEVRRFMVGRSGSALVDVVVVLDVVASGLLWSLPLVEAVSPGFEPKCGRFGSVEVVRTGTVFDGFKAVVVFRGAERGLTLP